MTPRTRGAIFGTCRLKPSNRMGSILVAALMATIPAQAQEQAYLSVIELQRDLYLQFKKPVQVEGQLMALDTDFGVLQDEAGGQLMVDLRVLASEVREELSETCVRASKCQVQIDGSIAHLRGEGISELGVHADRVTVVETR